MNLRYYFYHPCRKLNRLILVLVCLCCAGTIIKFLTKTNSKVLSYATEKSVESIQTKVTEYEFWDSETEKPAEDISVDAYCIVLLWTATQESPSENWPKEGTRLSGDCKITYQHRYLEVSGIVVIHQSQAGGIFPWILYRGSHQIFVWWSDLNPWHLKQDYETDMKVYNNFFNWTMNHRRDSTIYFPLWSKASLYNSLEGGEKEVNWNLKTKNRNAVWIANECTVNPANKYRMRYAVQLVQNQFQVDLFGDCFLSSDAMPNPNVLRQYRFYLSFIDSRGCRDYFTEQIWTPFRYGIVPVVLGPSEDDVINILPHQSFIHASWFKSPKELASYLFKLENNRTEYEKYFDWKKTFNLDFDDFHIKSDHPSLKMKPHSVTTGWSRLCEKFHETDVTKTSSVIPSIKKFAIETENQECLQ